LVLLGIYFLAEIEDEEFTAEDAQRIAEEWIVENAATYTERGGRDLEYGDAEEVEEGVYDVYFSFMSAFAGFGEVDEEEAYAQVETPHDIRVRVDSGEVTEAVTDEIFDEISGEMIEEDDEDLTSATVGLFFVEVVDDLEQVTAVERNIELINGVEESALVSLLAGVTDEEEEAGYSSAIPEGTELLSLDIDEGLATADFSSEIDPGGGSAWIMTIQEQVERTLLQFEEVEEVLILVEGQEDRLQP